jgi:hypothetical protein
VDLESEIHTQAGGYLKVEPNYNKIQIISKKLNKNLTVLLAIN